MVSEDKSFVKRLLTETWPAKMAQDALKALMLPGDVYQGKVSMYGEDGRTNPEVINRSADLAGLVTLGAGAVPAEANSLRSGIKAYHGSPHDFDRFDLSKIGTGEGAQAYGHGLYFAENEAVAQGYKQALQQTDLGPFDEIGIPPKDWNAARMFVQNSDPSQPHIAARDFAQWTGREVTPELVDAFKRAKKPGHMYEVAIKADPERFLDWDKPLREQGAAVQDKVWSGLRDNGLNQTMANYLVNEKSGADAYSAMTRGAYEPQRMMLDGGAPRATNTLYQHGLPGIKYLDAGSRTAGDGSRNYVVFDDNLIDIMRKYGLAGASASPLAALMASQGQGELQQ